MMFTNPNSSRSGKWTKEEEEYADKMIDAFHRGQLMDIEEGTSLRKYLSKKLSCSAKRISKKFEGTNYKGKMPYIKEFGSPPDERILRKKAELDLLEKKFLDAAALAEAEEDTRRQTSLAASAVPSPALPLPPFSRAASLPSASPIGLERREVLPAPPFGRNNSWSITQSQGLGGEICSSSTAARGVGRGPPLHGTIFPGASSSIRAPAAAGNIQQSPLPVSRRTSLTSATAPPSLPWPTIGRSLYGSGRLDMLRAAPTTRSSLPSLGTHTLDTLQVRMQMQLQESMRSVTHQTSPSRRLVNQTPQSTILSSVSQPGLADNQETLNTAYLQRNLRESAALEREVFLRRRAGSLLGPQSLRLADPSGRVPPKRTFREDDDGEYPASKRGNFYPGR